MDSEHFSIENYLNKNLNFKKKNLKKLFITASGGPFLYRSNDYIKFATFKEAIKHPKWNMGNKNSIDSATLVNKCLEIIEAHYLFNIEYKKLKIIIHPESLVHSIFEFDDLTSSLNYFYHDMFIPLFNFLNISNSKKVVNFSNRNYKFNVNSKLSFIKPSKNKFPILKLFEKMNKNQHHNIINFNAGNELAVDLFSKDKIKFGDINKIIEKSLSLDLKIELNNIENIIMYQNELIKKLKNILLGKY